MSECRGADCTHPECKAPARAAELDDFRRSVADALDPVVKYDGDGQPVRASQVGNRAERRALTRASRRGW